MADPNPPAPTITAVEPHQETLRDEGKIIVRWTANLHPFDQWHFIFAEDGHDFTEAEINIGSGETGLTGFFVISPTLPGLGYNFKVQGCNRGNIIFPNDCSDFNDSSANGRIIMPQNTRSLREFLRLSNVDSNLSIRSLGAPTFSAGIRAMMRL